MSAVKHEMVEPRVEKYDPKIYCFKCLKYFCDKQGLKRHQSGDKCSEAAIYLYKASMGKHAPPEFYSILETLRDVVEKQEGEAETSTGVKVSFLWCRVLRVRVLRVRVFECRWFVRVCAGYP